MLLLLIIILYDDTDNNAWDFQNIKSLDNLKMTASYSLVQKQSSRGVLFQNVFLEISQNLQENTSARVSFLTLFPPRCLGPLYHFLGGGGGTSFLDNYLPN